MSKHTPGPWKAGSKSVMAPETESRLGLDVRIFGGNTKDNRANARLISAAPDQHAVALELDRLNLVIESAVRYASPRNQAEVMALIRANKAAVRKAVATENKVQTYNDTRAPTQS
ncbi:MAG: hypothetical protein ACRCUE_15120 [Bosea sp. (in: a-proteobacteria)]